MIGGGRGREQKDGAGSKSLLEGKVGRSGAPEEQLRRWPSRKNTRGAVCKSCRSMQGFLELLRGLNMTLGIGWTQEVVGKR